MLNLFKKKPYLHFWSSVSEIEKIEPIRPATKLIPDWWKNLKTFTPEMNKELDSGTIKMCPSFVSYFKTLYTLTLWCDLKIKIDDNYNEWRTPDSRFTFMAHHQSQMKDHLPQHEKDRTKVIMKADCAWRAKTSKGYMLMQLPCTYDYNPIFDVPPGFIETSIYHELNPQLIFRQRGEFFIKRGTPICHYALVKKEDVDFKVYSKKEYFKIDPTYETIVKTKFHRAFKELQKINETSEN